jgi:hypothetical protein
MEPLPSYGLSETNFKLFNDGLSETEGVAGGEQLGCLVVCPCHRSKFLPESFYLLKSVYLIK